MMSGSPSLVRSLRICADVLTATMAVPKALPAQAQMRAFTMALAKARRRRLKCWRAAVR